ncbi:homoserine kinase [Candidatus Falkowbacteria bacterium]|nr:homoserine kinase [Candidatus Falkowbacteria bacterium]
MSAAISEAEALAMAQVALRHWGGDAPPRLIKNRENIVFEVHLPGGIHAALRLHRPGYQCRVLIDSELIWSLRLAEQGLGVPCPVPTPDGALSAVAAGRVASCVQWLEGRPIGCAEQPLAGDGAVQFALMQRLGGLIARLHNATDAAGLPAGFLRPAWDADAFLGQMPLWGRFWENPALRPDEREIVQEARCHAWGDLAAFRAEGADYGLIHGDLLRENVLDGPEGLALIDFDDSGFGFRAYDLATALVQSLEEPHLPQIAAGLVAGYRAHRPLPEAAVRRLPMFVMLRTFASAGWIITRAAPGDTRQRFYAERAARMAAHVLAGTAPWGALA